MSAQLINQRIKLYPRPPASCADRVRCTTKTMPRPAAGRAPGKFWIQSTHSEAYHEVRHPVQYDHLRYGGHYAVIRLVHLDQRIHKEYRLCAKRQEMSHRELNKTLNAGPVARPQCTPSLPRCPSCCRTRSEYRWRYLQLPDTCTCETATEGRYHQMRRERQLGLHANILCRTLEADW